MKKHLMMIMALVAGAAFADGAAIALADAEAKITAAIENPREMAQTMSRLSAADQTAFLAKVNAAIAAYKGSVEEKTALFVNANAAAMKSARKGNLMKLLAETFATVSVESLTVLNERFAADLFNRSADPSNVYSDADYQRVSTNAMNVIVERTKGEPDAGVRAAFAALLFLRASDGESAGLREAVLATLPAGEVRDLASKEWIPAAMGDGGKAPSYAAMLGAAMGAGGETDASGATKGATVAAEGPNMSDVTIYMGPQEIDALLADLRNCVVNEDGTLETPVLDAYRKKFTEPDLTWGTLDLDFVPRTLDRNAAWYPGNKRGEQKEPELYPFGSPE